MGSACGKPSAAAAVSNDEIDGGTLRVMFERFDKEKKGYISEQNLKEMMRDDKTYFQGKDAAHILEKYGTEGKMYFDNFKLWWGSTYTTYSNDDLARIVEEVNEEELNASAGRTDPMNSIPEISDANPRNSNVAVSRS